MFRRGRQNSMSVAATLEYNQDAENRSAPRQRLHLGSVLAGSGEEVLIHDLSASGFMIETSAVLSAGAMLQVELPERGPTAAWVVWRKDRFYGCEFVSRMSAAVLSAAMLRNPFPTNEPQLAPLGGSIAEAEEQDGYSYHAKMLTIFGLSMAAWLSIGLLAVPLL
jgi:hypothetical protein